MEKLKAQALHFMVASLFLLSTAETVVETDKQALLEFAAKIRHSRRHLNWNEHTSVCKNWTGIKCSEDGTRVIAARLPAAGLHGPIPANTLSRLSSLQILSLHSNKINGSFPLDLGNLKNLSFLYLQHNNFMGNLPLDFSVWRNLTIADFSSNGFNGSIPSSISSLIRLRALNLANNSLSGEIPDFSLQYLEFLNLSYNDLVGNVPKSLKRFPKSVFLGNNETLLDYNHKMGGISGKKALIVVVITVSSVFGLLVFIYFVKRKRRNGENKLVKGNNGGNKLVFFEGCGGYAFDLEDLLRASAEVLGKGSFGMAYKAVLEDSGVVVVKRLKGVAVGKREFEQQMEVIGGIRDENVVELKAYYYSKDEKLLVYEYYGGGSVDSMLHGKSGDREPPLNWPTRINIALGAARGLARVHAENNFKLVHGNVKSSNIFLNPKQLGSVSDLGLSSIMTSISPPAAPGAGYHAPELTDTRRATQPCDVYSFGVVLLELLTGKSPVHSVNNGEAVQLVRWVHSVVKEEWTAEVFDVELLRWPDIDEELVEMLRIAMACVVRVVEQRPKMAEVVEMLEGLRPEGCRNRASLDEKGENPKSSPSSSGVWGKIVGHDPLLHNNATHCVALS